MSLSRTEALEHAAGNGHSNRTGPTSEEFVMAWKKPRIVEVSLALEINSYACAEIG